jgi:hypothetical protein
VRSVTDRELLTTPEDLALLMLERVRMIDVVHAWAPSTLKSYQYKLRIVRRFEGNFGVPILRVSTIDRPPSGSAISLMWCQEHYSLQPTRWKKRHSTDIRDTITYNTVRSLRSAAAFFFKLDLITAHPGRVFADASSRPVVTLGCSATDELCYTMMNAGMARRMGTESNPSIALLDCHVRWLDSSLERRYLAAPPGPLRLEIVRAGLANMIAWLGWLRAMELFSIRWCDLDMILPDQGPTLGLPVGVGVIVARLLAQTKSDRTKTADIVLAHTTGSGLSPGRWLTRLRSLVHPSGGSTSECTDLLFVHAGGAPWTSHFFRSTYLIPSLHEQRLSGEPTLRPYDGSPGNTLMEKFWSMHSYRRGARSHVSRKRPGCVRKAFEREVTEHGRWRLRRSAMDMPTAYLEWNIPDRLILTLLCM